MMRAAAGFHGNAARRLLGDEGTQRTARELAAKDNLALGVDAKDVHAVLGQIDTDGGHRLFAKLCHGLLRYLA
jgi:hypothetical protein